MESDSATQLRDPLVQAARARVGQVLNAKYRIDRLLGIGGMAAVYAATHLRNANRVAVKVLHRELSVDRDLRGRFLREGYAANTVDHPGTVRVADDEVAEDGSVFLVMELLDGPAVDPSEQTAPSRRHERPSLARRFTCVVPAPQPSSSRLPLVSPR